MFLFCFVTMSCKCPLFCSVYKTCFPIVFSNKFTCLIATCIKHCLQILFLCQLVRSNCSIACSTLLYFVSGIVNALLKSIFVCMCFFCYLCFACVFYYTVLYYYAVLYVHCQLGKGQPRASLVCDVSLCFVTFPYGV